MIAKSTLGAIIVLLALGLIGLGVALASRRDEPAPLWQAEPLVPTAAPAGQPAPVEPAPTAAGLAGPLPADARQRIGIGVPYPPLTPADARRLKPGWYLAWRVLKNPPHPGGAEFVQMVRLSETGFRPDADAIRQAARANPGALWLIGNEPDVIWQDNVSPAQVAAHYHRLHALLKAADPTARVAIGGVAQPTPLRLKYLDAVLDAYRAQFNAEMPVDVWNIHNFILREERGSWGVDIPPGLPDDTGTLFEIADHADIEIFKAQIVAFRQWMAGHGQRNKPLVVSEYGILMPENYGFPPERVADFLRQSYQFMLTAADPALGDPADGNRLVQRWAWYSLRDDRYPTGNFIDFESGRVSLIGAAHQAFLTTPE